LLFLRALRSTKYRKTETTRAATAKLKFMHRNVEKDTQYTYEIVAVNDDLREGDPASVTVR